MSIKIIGLTKSFGKKTVMKNLTYTFETASRTAIAAPSGSGKTTLFRIIAGLDKRYSGECRVEGSIALMFQEDRLFDSSSVLENVCAVSDKPAEEAKKLLSDLGLADSIDAYPDTLSGGMKRRVALARALFFDADILLLDECFTGMDDETKKQAAEVINARTRGKTVLLITHDKAEAELLNCKTIEITSFK